jgi:hypothetical protein
VPQHLHRRFTHLGKELVDQARRAEGRPNPWLPSLLVPSTGSLSCHTATVAEARLRGNGGRLTLGRRAREGRPRLLPKI